jgi:hypothetical protein
MHWQRLNNALRSVSRILWPNLPTSFRDEMQEDPELLL